MNTIAREAALAARETLHDARLLDAAPALDRARQMLMAGAQRSLSSDKDGSASQLLDAAARDLETSGSHEARARQALLRLAPLLETSQAGRAKIDS